MVEVDCQDWIKAAWDQIPWDASPTLVRLRERLGEGVVQRMRDLILLPLLGYTSVNEAVEDLPYGKDALYTILNLEGIDWWELVEEITFPIFFGWLDYGLSHDPSTLSRTRLRVIFDHSLIHKWGHRIEDIANLFNHVTGGYQWSHKLVVAFVTVGHDRFRFPLAVRLWAKEAVPEGTHARLAAKICEKLHREAERRQVSLASVHVLCDKDYCTKDMSNVTRQAGMTLFTTPHPQHKFTCQGRTVTMSELQSPSFPILWRQSSKLRRPQPLLEGRYARLVVEHPDLGRCVLAIDEYVETVTHELKRHVYLCTDPRVDSVRVIIEARKMRWPVEEHFREDKQTGSATCYQGRKRRANHAHYALGALRSILLEHLTQLSRRKPTLSAGRRFGSRSAAARYLERNVRFGHIHKSEPFLRLRRGSLRQPPNKPNQTAKAAA